MKMTTDEEIEALEVFLRTMAAMSLAGEHDPLVQQIQKRLDQFRKKAEEEKNGN